MTDITQGMTASAPRSGPWIIGYVAAIAAAMAAGANGIIDSPGNAWPFWIPIIACAVMIVFTSWRRHRILGSVSGAVRRFWVRMVAFASFMFASYCLLAYGQMAAGWGTRALSIAATMPYAGFAGMIWAAHAYIGDETDEYLRSRAARQLLIASFVALGGAVVWSALATAGAVPAGQIGGIVLLWFAGMGIGRIVNEMRP